MDEEFSQLLDKPEDECEETTTVGCNDEGEIESDK